MVGSLGFTYLRAIRGKMATVERLSYTEPSSPRRHLLKIIDYSTITRPSTGLSWCGLTRLLSWFEERDGPLCQKCHLNKWRGDIPGREDMDSPSSINNGRPALVPTMTITLRIPTPVMDIIRRRAEDSGMSPGIWLVERVIRNEVVRTHKKLEDRSIREEIKLERGDEHVRQV